MDFLKSCTTGVQILPGFNSISYHIYAVERKDASPAERDDISIKDIMASLGSQLRARKYLACVDSEKHLLWIFRGGSNTGFADGPLDAAFEEPVRNNIALRSLYQGTLKTAELVSVARNTITSNTASTPTSASPSTPTAALRASQLANLRASQQNISPVGMAQEQAALPVAIDVRNLYSLFMSAVFYTVTYHLARHHQIAPLHTKTFAKIPRSGLEDGVNSRRKPLDPFSLDVYMTTGGTLVVSTGVDNQLELATLDAAKLSGSARMENGSQVYLAVAGLTAQLSEDSPMMADNADSLAWKELVRRKLELRGIQLAEIDKQLRWVLVRAWPASDQLGHGSDAVAFSGVKFYWPASLCFLDNGNTPFKETNRKFITGDTNTNDALAPISSWFLSPDDGGFSDPLRFAEEWFLGKPERDKVIEERRRKQREAEMAQKQAEAGAAFNVPSPFYTRGDLQAAGGVYPTPPDGLPSTSAPMTSDVPALSSSSDGQVGRPSVDYAIGESMDIDLGAFDDGLNQRGPSIISRGSLQLDQSLGDDLFGDDEDDFPENDITDADFSYFDDAPDATNTDMLDPLSIPATIPDEEVDPLTVTDSEALKLEADTQQASSAIPDSAPQVRFAEDVESINQELTDLKEEVVRETPCNSDELPQAEEASVKSPLTPIVVRKRLFEPVLGDKTNSRSLARGHSSFDAVPFNAVFNESDAKYTTDGSFSYDVPGIASHNLKRRAGLSFSLPPRKKRPRTSLPAFPGGPLAVAKYKQYDSDASGVTSDASDEDSLSEFESLSIVVSPVKAAYGDTRWNESLEDEATSIATSPGQYMPSDDGFGSAMGRNEKERTDLLLSILCPTKGRRPPPRLPQNPEPEQPLMLQLNPTILSPSMMSPPATMLESTLQPSHKDFISVAQIIAEQVIFGSIDLSSSAPTLITDSNGLARGRDAVAPVQTVQDAIKSLLYGASACDLLKYVCVQDSVADKNQLAKGQVQPPIRKANAGTVQSSDGTIVPANLFTSLPPPHVRVRRNEGLWDVLPPAIPFWEHLGLAPTSGRKNVMAFCVYPSNEDLQSQVALFLDYLGSTYESNRLGSHIRSDQLADYPGGLVPVFIPGEYSFQVAVRQLRHACAMFGKSLATIDAARTNGTSGAEEQPKIDSFVVYLVNPFDTARGVPELCSAFWTLYHTYRQAARSPMLQGSRPDIVLQIIPIDHVASSYAPVFPEPVFYQKLAREVYDRCPPATPDTSSSRLKIESAASIQLEQTLHKSIQFKLQSEPPSDIMHENSHFHLGYSRSKNGEWVTAAWTDNVGRYQATVSYCTLGRTFYEVGREMWQTSVEIMAARRVVWRFCVARVGYMEKEELDAWASFATSSSPLTIITVITSINPNPSLAIFPKQTGQNTTTNNASAAPTAQTPISTPQPGVSPDTTTQHVLTPAATPSASTDPAIDPTADPDAHLTDIGDEVWGLILAHKTNTADTIFEYRPSLSTGYLLKKNSGPATPIDSEEDVKLKGLVAVRVELLWIGSSPRQPSNNAQSSNNTPNPSPTNINPNGSGNIDPRASLLDTSAGATNTATAPANTSATAVGSNIPKNTADSILRDYLGIYRGLGVLARARGLIGSKRGVVPWHCVVAERGVDGLEAVYGNLG